MVPKIEILPRNSQRKNVKPTRPPEINPKPKTMGAKISFVGPINLFEEWFAHTNRLGFRRT